MNILLSWKIKSRPLIVMATIIFYICCLVYLPMITKVAYAATPAGCIWDHDQKVTVFPSGFSSAAACNEIGNESMKAGKYYLIIDKRTNAKNEPCQTGLGSILLISAAQFNSIKSDPSSYKPQSPAPCGTPPPPSIETASKTAAKEQAKKEKIKKNNEAFSASCGSDGGNPSTLCNLFDKYITPVLRFLSIGVGVIVTIMIVIGGIQYSTARGDPQAAANAKKKISNAVIALAAYGLLFALLQFLVPGGIF